MNPLLLSPAPAPAGAGEVELLGFLLVAAAVPLLVAVLFLVVERVHRCGRVAGEKIAARVPPPRPWPPRHKRGG